MDSVYKGWPGRRGWEAKGGLYYPLAQNCVFSKAKKQPQCTCQARTVIDSSLTPHAALLVCPSGTIHLIVDYYEFTGSEKCCLQTWLSAALSLVCLDSARVWLSCYVSYKLDFSSFMIMLGFGKSTHICNMAKIKHNQES